MIAVSPPYRNGSNPMPSETDDYPPTTHAIAEGWAKFAETVLPGVGGGAHSEAHVAFHFGAMYALQL